MATARGRTRRYLDIWPGYVDVLSTLLMVIIFTLMVFVMGQFFLGQVLSRRDKALAELNQHASELADMLALEKTTNSDLRVSVAQLSSALQQSNAAGDKLQQQLASTRADRDQLAAALADLKTRSAAMAAAKAEVDAKLEDAYKVIDADRQKVQTMLGDIAVLESLRDELKQQLEASNAQSADLQQKLTASQAESTGLQQQLSLSQSQSASLQQQLAATMAQVASLKEQLGSSAQQATESGLQVELLNRQLLALRDQLGQLTVALDASEAKAKADEVQVFDLGKRLNEALASKVEELARYRSEFFGKLREVLGNRPDVQIVGDRFIFQSEVLFATGSADIGEDGKRQLAAFADTLKSISEHIPTDIDWLLRVDGHTDKQPYNGPYGGNWELSTARAIAVVKFLIGQGIPPNRLVAAGFGEFRPLVDGDTQEDFRRNRRIELKLDQR
jgi:chemotaxis protein MotB